MVRFPQFHHAGHKACKFRLATPQNVPLHGGRGTGLQDIHDAKASLHQILLKRNAHGLAQGHHFADKPRKHFPLRAFLLQFITRNIEVSPGGSCRRYIGKLLQSIPNDVVAEVTANLCRLQNLFQFLRYRQELLLLPGTVAVNHPQHLIRLINHAGRFNLAHHIDTAIQTCKLRQFFLHHAASAKDIEHRNNQRVLAQLLPGKVYGIFDIVILHADKANVRYILILCRSAGRQIFDDLRAPMIGMQGQPLLSYSR